MNRLESMDVLRGIASLLVLLFHMEELGVASWPHYFYWGWIGVDLFFVLSGFFITICVLKPRKWDPKKFIERRFYRIAPPYYISMVLVVTLTGFYFISTGNGLLHVLYHILFLHTYIDGAHGSINGVYWSLGVEFSFYIFMMVMAKHIRGREFSLKLIILMIVSSWAWRAGCYFLLPEEVMRRFILSTQLFGMLDEFALGIMMAFIYLRHVSHGLRFSWPWVYIFLFSGIGLVALFVYNLNADYWSNFKSMVFSRTYLAIGFSLIMLSFIFLESEAYFHKICKYSGLPFLGTVSYSLYLYHLPIINSALSSKDNVSSNHVLALSVLVSVLLVSMVSYRFFEKPFMRSM